MDKELKKEIIIKGINKIDEIIIKLLDIQNRFN